MDGWNIRHGDRERNLLIAVATAAGAAVGGVLAWIFDELGHHHRGTLR